MHINNQIQATLHNSLFPRAAEEDIPLKLRWLKRLASQLEKQGSWAPMEPEKVERVISVVEQAGDLVRHFPAMKVESVKATVGEEFHQEIAKTDELITEMWDLWQDLKEKHNPPKPKKPKQGREVIDNIADRMAPVPSSLPKGWVPAKKHEPKLCHVTGKVRFSSERQAKVAQGRGRKKDRLRVYRCPHCNDFHMTSQIRSMDEPDANPKHRRRRRRRRR